MLMRLEDAGKQRRVYAVIRGWGISSDGQGGLTRPEVAGQQLALEPRYRRAGFGIDTVGYFEGHGTGTTVGDATELASHFAGSPCCQSGCSAGRHRLHQSQHRPRQGRGWCGRTDQGDDGGQVRESFRRPPVVKSRIRNSLAHLLRSGF